MLSLTKPLNRPIRDWNEQRVWIIGASSGIGEALSKALLDRGAQVVLSARRIERLQNLASSYPKAIALAMDVGDQGSWEHALAELKNQIDRIDLVIFCAAKYHPERSWELVPEETEHTLSVNLLSVYQGIQSVLPGMLERGHGGIGVVASVAGYLGLPNATVYGPSKAALINLTELLYSDLHTKNINVYLINPGFVSTELTAKNNFFMPALQTPAQAAAAIIAGFEAGDFEIHFPKRFTLFLKFMQVLPYRLRFALIRKFVTA
ncbi:SDR family NAD(P)-dependent oxidoreductase [Undibacterium cyanobacteriorum]|uniref:SDR family NAD(P)-dependent oxidoreductase n=1 Tax=Undibacterium cyanobacteriorum TaxID=3073561 RepID=A0ABY9RND4_9BURK|nr:SDR family NAD(P)-dependent oxidoreductase [Undibacterium sp. 20NA77.5]WMW82471.1 SDR family NAD(P)-dependent oxidoreductase [Undibacterium sp. 20NA77.5]